MSGKDVMPGTLVRSPSGAQEIWSRAYDGAVDAYGEGQHARWTAYAALKHDFERVGDHWEPKGRERPSRVRASAKARTRVNTEKNARVRPGECSPELLYLANRLHVARADRLSRREVVAAVRQRIGLATPGSAATRETQLTTT